MRAVHYCGIVPIAIALVLWGSLGLSYAVPTKAISDPDSGTVPAVPSEAPNPPPLYERPSFQRSPRPGNVIDLRIPVRCNSPKTCATGWAGACKKNCKRLWNTGLCIPKLGPNDTVISSEQCKTEERSCPDPTECKAPANQHGVTCKEILCPKGETACTIKPPRKYGTKSVFTGLCSKEASPDGELWERCERKEVKCDRPNQKKKVCCTWSPVKGSCDYISRTTTLGCIWNQDARKERFYATANNEVECRMYFQIETEALGGDLCSAYGAPCGYAYDAAVLNGECPAKRGGAKKPSGKR